MTEIAIDTKNRRLRLRLDLVGEDEPIDIDVTRYDLRRDPHGAEITIHSATASKQWLNVAIREFVIGKSFPIPPKAEALLKLLA